MPRLVQAVRPSVAALCLALAASGVRAGDVKVSWDQDLAFEWDRRSYEKALGEIVRTSEDEVAAWLGWSLTRPLVVEVLAPSRYEERFGSQAAWHQRAHYFRGAIHVNGGARLDTSFAGLMVHEITHALLDHRGTGATLPTWLGEGLAERLSWRRQGQDGLTTTQRQQLEVALEQRQLTPLPATARLSRFGYLQAYAAVLFLEERFGKGRLVALVQRALRGATFESALEAEAGWTVPKLEREFRTWVDHLQ